MGPLGRQPTIATTSSSGPADPITEDEDMEEHNPSNEELFGQLPEGKRRKFILVDDPQRGARVRVKVVLDKVKMDEIPDSYRMTNSVYPRTYFPVQMRDPARSLAPSKRFFRDDTEHADDNLDDAEASTVGRTVVPAPSLDGERNISVPKLSRRRHRKEVLLNDLAYRMSWSQSRVFAGRMLFMQRSRKCSRYFISLSLFLFPIIDDFGLG